MSNIIPFVSNSPPPMDGDQTCGWEDEEEDDFGNFASAPTSEPVKEGEESVGEGGFVAAWPASDSTSDATASGDKESSPQNNGQNVEEDSAGQSWSNHGAPQNKEESGENGAEDDDFADFAAFQDGSSKPEKPHLGSLPLKTTHQQKLDGDPDSDSGMGKGTDTVMEKSRESTTDSGLFSTDMSPLPQSESLCISEGEKTMHSDDETFSEMPQDSNSHIDTPSDQGQKLGHSDLSPEEDSQCEDSQVTSDKEASRQSDATVSADQRDQPEPAEFGDAEVIDGEASNADMPKSTTESLCQQEHSTSASPVPNSTDVDDNQQEVSPVPDNDISTEEADTDERQTSIPIVENSTSALGNEVQDSCSPDNDSAIEAVESSSTPSVDPSAHENQDSGDAAFVGTSSEKNNEDGAGGDDRAAFETKPPETRSKKDSGQQAEPEDLVLRKDSINFDDEDSASAASVEDASISENENSSKNREAEESGEEKNQDSAITKVTSGENNEQSRGSTPEDLPDTQNREENSELQQTASSDKSVDIPSTQTADNQQTAEVRQSNDSGAEDDGFGDFRSETVPDQTISPSENNAADQENGEDFAKFSSTEAAPGNSEKDDFGDFSSGKTAGAKDDDNDDEDDFGDFNSGSLSSSVTATNSEKADSGAVPNKTADTADQDDDFDDFHGPSAASSDATVKTAGNEDFGAFSNKSADASGEDDFGDFSAQPAASSDSGWANFSQPAEPSASEDDFGNFSAPTKTESTDKVEAPLPASGARLSPHSHDMTATKFEAALKSCFPVGGPGEEESMDKEAGNDDMDLKCADKSKLGVLETILEYGLAFRSASQQTWQVVQHPSRKDPRVRLWGQLQDMDGSPAVVYHWGKSITNSHLFHTLHIDTQNMLIGHKKRSVPIFATGLSLLEPIRGGRKDREAVGNLQPNQNIAPSPSLVDSSGQEPERRSQEIPAVDFDWSTSGLTNPLTSHSLDLDFLVAQDTQASDKPSVFQSELLDAPRASVKSSQPLEDILKNVKPTSVRSRRDEAATSQMSPEAVRVLASLPDLSFMQSKVLMFPIKN